MGADFTLYAVTESEWPRWKYLSNVESWIFSDDEDDNSNEFDEEMSMIDLFHQDGRSLFIGEVSFLKAGLMEDYDRYVPKPVQGIRETVRKKLGNPLTERMAKSIVVSMNKPNNSIYKHRYLYVHPDFGWKLSNYDRTQTRSSGIQRPRVVKKWLNDHIGYRISYAAE